MSVEGPATDEVMPQRAEVSPPIALDQVETVPAEPLPRESAILQLASVMGETQHDATESREGVLDRLGAMAEPDPQEM